MENFDFIEKCLQLERMSSLSFVRSLICPGKTAKYWKAWDEFWHKNFRHLKGSDEISDETLKKVEEFEKEYNK